jgi:peptidoglycan/LPS O-acetylase OafA/YrhL
MDRRPELDGLRGAAALIVVISHCTNETNLWGGMLGFGGGQLGVMIFFALSGYLMGALYLNRKFRPAPVWEYVARRIARVGPLYYLVVLMALGVFLFAPAFVVYEVTPANVIQHLGFVSGVSVLWTIPVEIQFYCTFLMLWGVRSLYLPAFIVICLIGLATAWFLPGDPVGWRHTLPLTLPFFLIGLLISVLPEAGRQWSRHVWSVPFLASCALVLAAFPRIYPQVFGQQQGEPWLEPICMISIAALLTTTLRSSLARMLFGNVVGRYLGAISYSVYLLHYPVLVLIKNTTTLKDSPELFLAATIGGVLILATITYLLVERPARVWISKSLIPPKTELPAAA